MMSDFFVKTLWDAAQ